MKFKINKKIVISFEFQLIEFITGDNFLTESNEKTQLYHGRMQILIVIYIYYFILSRFTILFISI